MHVPLINGYYYVFTTSTYVNDMYPSTDAFQYVENKVLYVCQHPLGNSVCVPGSKTQPVLCAI